MKRLLLIVLAGLMAARTVAADFSPACINHPDGTDRRDSLLAVFWNLENFFDYHSGSRPQYWTGSRFRAKCSAVSKTLLRISEDCGRFPDIVCLAEVENAYVLRCLVGSTLLRKLGYRTVHYDSPDHRGIDCALLYRPRTLELTGSAPKHIRDSLGQVMATRDILLAQFGPLAVLVNHHPSKIGGKTHPRDAAMRRMLEVKDSLLCAGAEAVLAVGDFNDELWKGGADGSDASGGRASAALGEQEIRGTIKYNGAWEKIDGHFAFGRIAVREEIFADRMLLEQDKAFGGLKPRRSFIGPRYNGGISDHLPIVLHIAADA